MNHQKETRKLYLKDFIEIVIVNIVFTWFSVNLYSPNRLVRTRKLGSKISVHVNGSTIKRLQFKFVIRSLSKKMKVTWLGISRLEIVKDMWNTFVETQNVNGLKSHLLLIRYKGLVVKTVRDVRKKEEICFTRTNRIINSWLQEKTIGISNLYGRRLVYDPWWERDSVVIDH